MAVGIVITITTYEGGTTALNESLDVSITDILVEQSACHQPVLARTAIEVDVLADAEQSIIAEAAEEGWISVECLRVKAVIAVTAIEEVGPLGIGELIVTGTAVEGVVAEGTVDDVIAIATIDEICAGLTVDGVVASIAVDSVGTCSAANGIGIGGAVDELTGYFLASD